jgi:hypothetical protein
VIDCTFTGNEGCVNLWTSAISIERCTFIGNIGPAPAVGVYHGSRMLMRQCTLCGNATSHAGIIRVGYEVFVGLDQTIVAFTTQGMAVSWTYPCLYEPELECCKLLGNAGGDWVECIADQFRVAGNNCEDTLFCDALAGDLTLDASSPCAPEHSG